MVGLRKFLSDSYLTYSKVPGYFLQSIQNQQSLTWMRLNDKKTRYKWWVILKKMLSTYLSLNIDKCRTQHINNIMFEHHKRYSMWIEFKNCDTHSKSSRHITTVNTVAIINNLIRFFILILLDKQIFVYSLNTSIEISRFSQLSSTVNWIYISSFYFHSESIPLGLFVIFLLKRALYRMNVENKLRDKHSMHVFFKINFYANRMWEKEKMFV